MRNGVRLRLLLASVASLAIATAGCGSGSSADGTTAQTNPKLAEDHNKMKDYMSTHKPEAGVNNKTMRNHP
jgi:hypothetical protein